jgi:predicted TIM-barrel fold metal-dependent hydrolase
VIDTNVYLSRWPTRRLPLDETPRLVERLKAGGVSQAWAGSFDGLLHKDISGINARLADECRAHGDGMLLPVGTVNPTLPDWEEDLRRCHETHQMSGVRLHPNYHGYTCAAAVFATLLKAAARRGLFVQIVLRMEDPRTQHRLLTAADVDPEPLISLLPTLPGLRIQLLNSLNNVRPDVLDKLTAAGNVSVEIAMLEGIGGIANLLKHVSHQRVLFGSYSPFFALEAASLKLRESALAQPLEAAIQSGNAERLLGGR